MIESDQERNFLSNRTQLMGGVHLEAPVRTYGAVSIKRNCKIGKFSFINNNCTLHSRTVVGRYCSIGKNCELGAWDHPLDWLSSSPVQYNLAMHFPTYSDEFLQKEILRDDILTIENDVWVASNCVVLRGVVLGNGCVVAGGSVVTKDVPPYAIVGGVPAKILKYRFTPEIIEKLLAIKWWDLPSEILHDLPFDDIEQTLQILETRKTDSDNQIKKNKLAKPAKLIEDEVLKMNDNNDKNSILAILKNSTDQILNDQKPSEFADDEFMAMLVLKLEDRNVDPRVVDFIAENSRSIHGNYDAFDADQVEILNNKVEQAYQLFAEAPNRDEKLSQSQQKLIKRLFGSKN